MKIKSEAQRKRLQTLAEQGKLKPETLTAMEADVEGQLLPVRTTWPRSMKVKTLRAMKTPKGTL